MSELTTEQKIEWIVNNEGCELADGYHGLQMFIRYCLDDAGRDAVLGEIAIEVDATYQAVRDEMDEMDEQEGEPSELESLKAENERLREFARQKCCGDGSAAGCGGTAFCIWKRIESRSGDISC